MKFKLLSAAILLSSIAYLYTGSSESSMNVVEIELPKADPKVGYEVIYTVNVYNERLGKYVNLNSDLGALSANVYFESANQPTAGQVAVAWVTLNRLKYFSNTSIQGAVKNTKIDSYGQPVKDKCHFSWYCDGQLIKVIKSDDVSQNAFSKAVAIADKVINNNVKDPTNGATHYCTLAVEKTTWWVPYMKKETRKVIGDHVFYVHDQKKFDDLWKKKLAKMNREV
jgi:spore germination cell wall hydrolase CwlJ-like protein